jgi:hypothetical protein
MTMGLWVTLLAVAFAFMVVLHMQSSGSLWYPGLLVAFFALAACHVFMLCMLVKWTFDVLSWLLKRVRR